MTNPNLYLDESHLITRLQEAITDAEVGSVAVITGTHDITRHCPGVFLAAGNTEIRDTIRRGTVAALSQRWEVTVIVVHHQGNSTTTATRAGALLAQVLDALIGYQVVTKATPYALVDILPPSYGEQHAEFTAIFERKNPLVAPNH